MHSVMSSPALVTGSGSPATVSASSPTGPASPIASPALPRRLMNLSSSSTASTSAPPLAPLSQPRTNLTGKLTVRLFDVRGLHPERLLEGVFCVVKVDNTVRAKTKSKFKAAVPSWNEVRALFPLPRSSLVPPLAARPSPLAAKLPSPASRHPLPAFSRATLFPRSSAPPTSRVLPRFPLSRAYSSPVSSTGPHDQARKGARL